MKPKYIYKITNNINNKVYIGKALDPLSRFKRHLYLSDSNKSKAHLHLAIKKYGKDNFSFEIIDGPIYKNIDEREKYWIQYYDSFNCGYNMTLGGDGGDTISIHPERDLICKKMSKSKQGHIVSEETKLKISEANKGSNNGMYMKHGPLHPNYGRTITEETRLKLKKSHLGKSNKGYKLSEETKRKISLSKTGCKINHKHGIAVRCIETGKEYISSKEAERDTGIKNILLVCNGKRKTAGKLHWEFI